MGLESSATFLPSLSRFLPHRSHPSLERSTYALRLPLPRRYKSPSLPGLLPALAEKHSKKSKLAGKGSASRLLVFRVSVMASQFALRRLASSLLAGGNLHRPVRSLNVAPWCASRSFNTNAQMTRMRGEDDDDDREMGIDRRSARAAARRGDVPAFFSDVFDPFSPTRSVSQLMNLMDQLSEFPFAAGSRGSGGITRRGWDAKEDENALYLRVDMPGLGKEDIKVAVEENTLTIKGEQGDEASEEEKRRYSTRIDLTPKLFKVDSIKAEMKNGVLKVVVPKVKEDERKDVFQIQVE